MKTSTTIGIAAIAAIGIGAYFLLKDFKLGDLFAAPLVMAGAAPETIKETGAIGGVGDVIYNIGYGGDLRKEATVPSGEYFEAAKEEISTQIVKPGEHVPQEAIVARAVSMGVAETMHEDMGFIPSMLAAPITIGAGLGAITQQQRYRDALPTEEAKEKALKLEYTTRQDWIKEHPVESMIGFPAGIIHAVTTPHKQTDFFSTMARGWGRIFG